MQHVMRLRCCNSCISLWQSTARMPTGICGPQKTWQSKVRWHCARLALAASWRRCSIAADMWFKPGVQPEHAAADPDVACVTARTADGCALLAQSHIHAMHLETLSSNGGHPTCVCVQACSRRPTPRPAAPRPARHVLAAAASGSCACRSHPSHGASCRQP